MSGTPTANRWNCDQADLPWFDQPNALELLEERRLREGLSARDFSLLRQWCLGGYCILPRAISDDLIDPMVAEFETLWSAEQAIDGLVFHGLKIDDQLVDLPHAEALALEPAKRFAIRDNSPWRLHGFHGFSAHAQAIANYNELLRVTALIFGEPAVPHYTINFMYGTHQNIHQDMAVFHVFPWNYIIGVWIACEDISPDSGPLVFYPGSHREPLYKGFADYPENNLRTADLALSNEYYSHVNQLTQKYEERFFLAKKGDVFLWHGLLLHGGSEIKNPQQTRKSYVIHFIPPGKDVIHQLAIR